MLRRRELSLFEMQSEVHKRVPWLAIIYLALCAANLVESRCMAHYGGYKCVVSSQDSMSDLVLKIRNIHSSSDIKVNATRVIGGCRNFTESRMDPESGVSYKNRGERVKMEEMLLIPRGGTQTVTLDGPPSNRCSKYITRSCLTSSGQQLDCRSVITIN